MEFDIASEIAKTDDRVSNTNDWIEHLAGFADSQDSCFEEIIVRYEILEKVLTELLQEGLDNSWSEKEIVN